MRKTQKIHDDRDGGQSFEVLELLAEVSADGEGKPFRTVLQLWSTPDGRYGVQKIGVAQVYGKTDRVSAWLCEDENAVKKSLKGGPLAWRLFREAGWD